MLFFIEKPPYMRKNLGAVARLHQGIAFHHDGTKAPANGCWILCRIKLLLRLLAAGALPVISPRMKNTKAEPSIVPSSGIRSPMISNSLRYSSTGTNFSSKPFGDYWAGAHLQRTGDTIAPSFFNSAKALSTSLRSIPVISAILPALTGAPNSRMACNTFSFIILKFQLSIVNSQFSINLHLHYQPVLCADLLNHFNSALAPVEVFLLVGQICLQNVKGEIVLAYRTHALAQQFHARFFNRIRGMNPREFRKGR